MKRNNRRDYLPIRANRRVAIVRSKQGRQIIEISISQEKPSPYRSQTDPTSMADQKRKRQQEISLARLDSIICIAWSHRFFFLPHRNQPIRRRWPPFSSRGQHCQGRAVAFSVERSSPDNDFLEHADLD